MLAGAQSSADATALKRIGTTALKRIGMSPSFLLRGFVGVFGVRPKPVKGEGGAGGEGGRGEGTGQWALWRSGCLSLEQ